MSLGDRDHLKGTVKGQYGDTIQSLPIDATVHQAVAVGAGSLRVDMTDAQLVRIAFNTDAYIAFGDVTITASPTDIFFPAGVEVLVMPKDTTHVAYIQESVTGKGSISKVGG